MFVSGERFTAHTERGTSKLQAGKDGLHSGTVRSWKNLLPQLESGRINSTSRSLRRVTVCGRELSEFPEIAFNRDGADVVADLSA
jgi:hypothetical protein